MIMVVLLNIKIERSCNVLGLTHRIIRSDVHFIHKTYSDKIGHAINPFRFHTWCLPLSDKCHRISVHYSTSGSFSSSASASFPTIPLPVTRHVTKWSRNPGGPIKLVSKTECGVKTPLFKPSNQIHRPTNKSQVSTWLHSSVTKLGYFIIPIIAAWGSPLGSNTPLNSSMGAVPFSCVAEATTMKKWISEKTMIPPYPPITFLVIFVLGNKTSKIQRYCGPKVAKLKACLIFSFDSTVSNPAESIVVVDSITVEGSIMTADKAGDLCLLRDGDPGDIVLMWLRLVRMLSGPKLFLEFWGAGEKARTTALSVINNDIVYSQWVRILYVLRVAGGYI